MTACGEGDETPASVRSHAASGPATAGESAVIQAALASYGEGPLHLGAQAYLQGWYERFGFRQSGDGYVEDGIPHVPMRRVP